MENVQHLAREKPRGESQGKRSAPDRSSGQPPEPPAFLLPAASLPSSLPVSLDSGR